MYAMRKQFEFPNVLDRGNLTKKIDTPIVSLPFSLTLVDLYGRP